MARMMQNQQPTSPYRIVTSLAVRRMLYEFGKLPAEAVSFFRGCLEASLSYIILVVDHFVSASDR